MALIRQLLVLVALLAMVVSAAGCNTVAGVGKDLEKAGETIQRKAK